MRRQSGKREVRAANYCCHILLLSCCRCILHAQSFPQCSGSCSPIPLVQREAHSRPKPEPIPSPECISNPTSQSEPCACFASAYRAIVMCLWQCLVSCPRQSCRHSEQYVSSMHAYAQLVAIKCVCCAVLCCAVLCCAAC